MDNLKPFLKTQQKCFAITGVNWLNALEKLVNDYEDKNIRLVVNKSRVYKIKSRLTTPYMTINAYYGLCGVEKRNTYTFKVRKIIF